jgi:hypothetical protein
MHAAPLEWFSLERAMACLRWVHFVGLQIACMHCHVSWRARFVSHLCTNRLASTTSLDHSSRKRACNCTRCGGVCVFAMHFDVLMSNWQHYIVIILSLLLGRVWYILGVCSWLYTVYHTISWRSIIVISQFSRVLSDSEDHFILFTSYLRFWFQRRSCCNIFYAQHRFR